MSKAWWSKGYFSGYWGKSSTRDDKKSGEKDYTTYGGSYDEWNWKDSYKSRYKSSLGYSTSRLSETVSYSSTWNSSYYKGGSDIEASRLILERAYKSARDLVIVLDFPFKIHIQIDQKDDFFYDTSPNSRRLFIPTSVLDDSEYTKEEKINVCSGLAIHEAAHLKFTEINVLNSFLSKLEGYRSIEGEIIKKGHIEFLSSLINIIEDERVEDKLLTERPGYTDLIDKAKGWSYKTYIKGTKSSSGKVEAFLNNLFRLIRYPEGLDNNVLEEYSEQYSKIQNYLSPLPESTKESCIVGFKIYKEIINIFKELKLSVKDVDSFICKIGRTLTTVYSKCLYGFDGDSKEDVGSGLIFSAIKDSSHHRSGGSSILAGLVTGSVETGIDKKTYFKKISGNEIKYRAIANKVSKYIPAIRKLIKNTDKNYVFNIHGCRSGLLDTSKLAEAYQGVPQVYIRQGKVTTNSSNVCVLIDESGSMRWSDKDEYAREAAILLNEALKDIPGVDLYIYGHTADSIYSGSTELNIYREGKRPVNPYALSESKGTFENRDGVAIYEAGQRVRKFTSSPVLMFVISDGEPAACNYHGGLAISDVRKKVSKLEKDGFTIIQITIDTVNHADEMFTNVIDMRRDVSELPRLLAKTIKKAIINDKKTTVS